MATTTNYGWTTPDDSSLVKDGAAAIRTLGSSIDTSLNTALGTRKAGMVLISTTSFTAQSTISIDNVFSTTFDNYLIKFNNCIASSNTWLSMRLRVAGADETSANYHSQYLFAGGTSVAAARYASATSWVEVMRIDSTQQNLGDINIFTPFATRPTTASMVTVTGGATTSIDTLSYVRGLNTATSYTGFTVLTGGAPTITGSVSVYGFNK